MLWKQILDPLFYWLYKKIATAKERHAALHQAMIFPNVKLGEGYTEGTIKIGEGTYINSNFRIVSGINSKVQIGKYCAIGRNFSCASRTHDPARPTADEENSAHLQLERDIIIGDYVWIGDNVFIKHGVKVADYSIIGVNSVLLRDTEPFEIVAGAPARHIRYNERHYKFRKSK